MIKASQPQKSPQPDPNLASPVAPEDRGPDPMQDTLETRPESERWNPLPGSSGHPTPINPSEDEDEDGRSTDQQLVEDGIAKADEDRRQQAADSNP